MGIVAVKNLVEEGFDVTGFERNPYVGGLWHYTDDKDTLSVLPGEDRSCMSNICFLYLTSTCRHPEQRDCG
jgi:cation diffusion facilitator CzcD-associated flavoprotein CzcO